MMVVRLVEKLANFVQLKRKHVEYSSFPTINGIIELHGHGHFIIEDNVRINAKRSANPIGGYKVLYSLQEIVTQLLKSEKELAFPILHLLQAKASPLRIT